MDELDLAVLNIGLDDGYVQENESLTQDQPPPCSLKPPQESPERDSPYSCQHLYDKDDADIEGHEELPTKKRRRNNKNKRKQPRRLPVDELVLVYEREGGLNLQGDCGEYPCHSQ